MNSIERKQARYHRRKAKREAKRLEKIKDNALDFRKGVNQLRQTNATQ